jgi:hypothetical protein
MPAMPVPTVPLTTDAAGSTKVVFRDGFGPRRRILSSDAALIDVLSVRRELSSGSAFEFALRERAGRLAGFRHTCFGRVRGIERLRHADSGVALVSEAVPGMRLIDLLAASERRLLAIDFDLAMYLTRQLMSAVAMLHANTGVAHGAIGPERIVVTPTARLVVVEYVLGGALEELGYSRERYWNELRVASRDAAGELRFDCRSDLVQVGLVTSALLLGRRLRDDEFPAGLERLVATLDTGPHGGTSVAGDLRGWLVRLMRQNEQVAFTSAIQAQAELGRILGKTNSLSAAAALEAFIATADRDLTVPPVRYDVNERYAAPPGGAVGITPLGAEASLFFGGADPSEDDERVPAAAEDISAQVEAGAQRGLPWLRVKRNGIVVAASLGVVAAGGFASRHFLASSTSSHREAASTREGIAVRDVTSTRQVIDDTAAPVAAIPDRLDGHMALAGANAPMSGSQQAVPSPIATQPAPGDRAVSGRDDRSAAAMTSTAVAADAVKTRTAPAPQRPTGWLVVSAREAMSVMEGGNPIGTTEGGRLSLPEGSHDLELVDDVSGFRVMRSVRIAANRVSSLTIEFPKVPIAINAAPWADVWIDGERVGQTPVGNLAVTVGSHELLFRHPELGEQRQVITVTVGGSARFSADLSRK